MENVCLLNEITAIFFLGNLFKSKRQLAKYSRILELTIQQGLLLEAMLRVD